MSPSPAIEPIRVEMLSTELPIHQLAKRGEDEIRIIRRGPNGGQVSLYWKVEPNPSVGRPGQLAYHLDTWVIRRRLDEFRRPIPRLIRVGDLREIARDLHHGGDTNAIKRAFEQNASAFIRAKLAYRTRDGREERFEGYFNRYNVFYRGQTLPGGGAAETVYISLNDPYYRLINGSTWRPLDYQYLRRLHPAAQRFYELVSPKMFAAIKNGHPTAWIRYSDFCSLAVQRRQETRRRMQIQMAAVHRPHLASGYVGEVSWRPERLGDQLPDWIIHYVPGPRARAEFEAFNGGRSRIAEPLPHSSAPICPASPDVLPAPSPEPGSIRADASSATSLALRFAEERNGSVPRQLTPGQIAKAQAILDALDGDYQTALLAVTLAAGEGRTARSGYPGHLGGVIEGGFIERARSARDEDLRRASIHVQKQRDDAQRNRHEVWCRQRSEERVAALSQDERRRILEDRLPAYIEEFRYFIRLRSWTGERVSEWAEPKVLERYGHEGQPSFEEWCKFHDSETTGSSRPGEPLQ